MKFAFALLVLLPLALSATVDEKRFFQSLLSGYDINDLVKQLATHFGDETEAQCEYTLCPELVNKIDGNNTQFTNLLCGLVCKEAHVSDAH